MTAIANFTQAVKELTGFDEDKNTSRNNLYKGVDPRNAGEKNHSMEFKPAEPIVNIPHFDESTGSRITRTMTVKGNITGRNPIMLDGKAAGDINIDSTITVNGTVVGDVNADSAVVNGALKGNVKAATDVQVSDRAIMVGDVTARNILVFGKVKGNLDIANQTEMKSEALIVGDLTTNSFASEPGSVIHGSVKTKDTRKLDFDEDSLFNI